MEGQWEVFETPDQVEDVEQTAADPALDTPHSEDIDVSPAPKPEQAFEVFCGKRFVSDTAKSTKTSTDFSSLETPLERYNRLRMEVDSFLEDLDALGESSQDPTMDSEPYQRLTGDVKALKTQLTQAGDNSAFAPFLSDKPLRSQLQVASQAAIGDHLRQSLRQLSNPDDDQSAAAAAPPAIAQDQMTKFELFYSPEVVESSTQAQVSALESRIARLENAIGLGESGTTSTPASGTSLVDLIANMETKVALLDPSTLNTVSRKVATLSVEIDTFQNKHKNVDHEILPSQLDGMLDKLERCDAIAQTIPGVVTRLQSLHSLHKETNLFGGRLSQVEATHATVENLIESNKTLLDQVQQGVAKNTHVIESNLDSLAKRIEALGE